MEKDEQEWKIFNKECPRDEQKIEVKLLGNVLKGYYSGLVGNFFVSEKDGEHILLFCTHNLKWRPVLQRTDSGISISEIVKCGQWKKLNIANNLEPNRHEYMFTDENGE